MSDQNRINKDNRTKNWIVNRKSMQNNLEQGVGLSSLAKPIFVIQVGISWSHKLLHGDS